jgi:hypothetical protein
MKISGRTSARNSNFICSTSLTKKKEKNQSNLGLPEGIAVIP